MEVVLRGTGGELGDLRVDEHAHEDGEANEPSKELDPGGEDKVVGGHPPAAAADAQAAALTVASTPASHPRWQEGGGN